MTDGEYMIVARAIKLAKEHSYTFKELEKLLASAFAQHFKSFNGDKWYRACSTDSEYALKYGRKG